MFESTYVSCLALTNFVSFNFKASTDNIYDAVAARYGQSGGTFGLLKNCAELAGYVTIPKMIRGTVRENRIHGHSKKSSIKILRS